MTTAETLPPRKDFAEGYEGPVKAPTGTDIDRSQLAAGSAASACS